MKKENKKTGRPKKYNIQKEKVEQLASFGCTNTEIASFFGCDVSLITKTYSQFLTKGRDKGKIRLRQLQWKSAEKGNTAMLIWLGKQILNQTDKSEVELVKPFDRIELEGI
jgi:hypothetical protein|tara:strand:+ start:266 stop:598 length:333 start_codon:yes stop_codon:yes gene_type:complete